MGAIPDCSDAKQTVESRSTARYPLIASSTANPTTNSTERKHFKIVSAKFRWKKPAGHESSFILHTTTITVATTGRACGYVCFQTIPNNPAIIGEPQLTLSLSRPDEPLPGTLATSQAAAIIDLS